MMSVDVIACNPRFTSFVNGLVVHDTSLGTDSVCLLVVKSLQLFGSALLL